MIVAILGVQQVDINGKVLAILLTLEVGVIVIFSAASVANPAGGAVTFTTLEPGNLFASGLGAMLVLGVLGFIGFEAATVFAEESRNPRRTVPAAMYTAIAIIAVLYTLGGWAMSVAVGPDQIVTAAGEQEVELIFGLAADHLGALAADIGFALLLTSLLAAMIAFHNITSRYMFALGRERVIPAVFGRTSHRTSSPVVASATQTLIGLIVITVYAVAGWDPLVQLFFWAGTAGGLGVLLLITMTSAAVVAFFARHRYTGENLWRRVLAPVTASALLLVVAGLALAHFATLLGVEDGHPLRWGVPAAYLTVAVLGAGWGLLLRSARPEVYAGIGRGARALTGGDLPEQVPGSRTGTTPAPLPYRDGQR